MVYWRFRIITSEIFKGAKFSKETDIYSMWELTNVEHDRTN